MNKSQIKVLYVDDESNLLDVTKLFLKKIDSNIDLDTAVSAKQGLEMIADGNYDAIISDYEMPDIDGIEFLKIIKKDYPYLPFIIFTGRGREEVVMEALNLGADFYIQKGSDVKSQFAELVHKVRIAVTKNRYKTALHNYNERLSLILGSANIGLLDYECATGNAFFSPNYYTMLGYDQKDINGDLESWLNLIHPDDLDSIMSIIENNNGNNGTHETEFRIKTKYGDYKWISSRGKVVERDQEGKPVRIVGVHTDISSFRDAKENLKVMEDDVRSSIKGTLPTESDHVDDALTGGLSIERDSVYTGESIEKELIAPIAGVKKPFTMLPYGERSVFYAVGLSKIVRDEHGDPICNTVSFYYIEDIKKEDENR